MKYFPNQACPFFSSLLAPALLGEERAPSLLQLGADVFWGWEKELGGRRSWCWCDPAWMAACEPCPGFGGCRGTVAGARGQRCCPQGALSPASPSKAVPGTGSCSSCGFDVCKRPRKGAGKANFLPGLPAKLGPRRPSSGARSHQRPGEPGKGPCSCGCPFGARSSVSTQGFLALRALLGLSLSGPKKQSCAVMLAKPRCKRALRGLLALQPAPEGLPVGDGLLKANI